MCPQDINMGLWQNKSNKEKRNMIYAKSIAGLILTTFFLISCATTTNPFANTGKGVEEVESVDFPEIDKVTYGFLGDTLVSKGTKSSVPAIRVLDEWVLKEETSFAPRQWVAANTEFVLTGIWMLNKTGQEYKCYTGKYNYDAHWNFYNRVGKDLPFDLCKDKFGTWKTIGQLNGNTRTGLGPGSGQPFNARYEEYTKTELKGVSFIQEFLYNGRVDNALKFVYREFSGDLARPAFTQEIQYDLDQSNTIGFKSLRIEIIEATNTNITFKVLQTF